MKPNSIFQNLYMYIVSLKNSLNVLRWTDFMDSLENRLYGQNKTRRRKFLVASLPIPANSPSSFTRLSEIGHVDRIREQSDRSVMEVMKDGFLYPKSNRKFRMSCLYEDSIAFPISILRNEWKLGNFKPQLLPFIKIWRNKKSWNLMKFMYYSTKQVHTTIL